MVDEDKNFFRHVQYRAAGDSSPIKVVLLHRCTGWVVAWRAFLLLFLRRHRIPHSHHALADANIRAEAVTPSLPSSGLSFSVMHNVLQDDQVAKVAQVEKIAPLPCARHLSHARQKGKRLVDDTSNRPSSPLPTLFLSSLVHLSLSSVHLTLDSVHLYPYSVFLYPYSLHGVVFVLDLKSLYSGQLFLYSSLHSSTHTLHRRFLVILAVKWHVRQAGPEPAQPKVG